MPLMQSEVSLASNPIDIHIGRSRVTKRKTITDTFNSGELVPLYMKDVLPGTSVEMYFDALVRLNTPLHPTCDSAFLDVFFFFVPFRLTWDHWVNLRGENSNTYWETPTEYTVPQITSPANDGWSIDSVADHFGFRPLVPGYSVSALPFRGYAMIWNEFFRSEFLTQPVSIDTGDTDVVGENATWSDYVTKGTLGGSCLRVARMHDVFSDALLEPQVGTGVEIPFDVGSVPVVPADINYVDMPLYNKNANAANTIRFLYENSDGKYSAWLPETSHALIGLGNETSHIGDLGFGTADETASGTGKRLVPGNLVADLSGTVSTGITINDLRQAVVTQQVLETLNRGNRYVEILENAFKVQSPDSRLQRPEFLGTRRIPISMQEINQTSSTDATSPLGTPGATSKTVAFDNEPIFQKSFVEDGMIIGLMCARNARTYSQSVPMWTRKRERFDFFYPQMQGLGDRPIPNSMIYCQSDSEVDDDGNVINDMPFGYQQAWFEYFTDYNEVRGLFRPDAPSTLASWNYADSYDSLPNLSTLWMYDKGNIARTLAVQNQPEFRIQAQINSDWVIPMQVGRAPGLHTI